MAAHRAVADLSDSEDSDRAGAGGRQTIAALKALQKQICKLEKERYAALSRAALLRQEIADLDATLEEQASTAVLARPTADVAAATAGAAQRVAAAEAERDGAAADLAALRDAVLAAANGTARAAARLDAAVANASARRAAADTRLEALARDDATADAELLRRHAAETRLASYERRLAHERQLRFSLHDALEEMLAVNKRLAAVPRYARETTASKRAVTRRPPLNDYLRDSKAREKKRRGRR